MYENVLDCPKTRVFMKRSGLSRSEAVGTLVTLWLWGIKYAEPDGLIKYADRQDIADVISARSGLTEHIDPISVVDSMISSGWIDEVEGSLYLHDWDEWQEHYYKYEEKKRRDTERKRKYREAQRALGGASPQDHTPTPPPKEPPPTESPSQPGKAPKTSKPQKANPDKKQYAEFVTMTEAEYGALVKKYGESATKRMIEVLDNYKGSSGKTYKSDYRTILNWVWKRVQEESPGLIRPQTTAQKQPGGLDDLVPGDWSTGRG